MARVVRLTPRYLRQLRACGVKPGSDAQLAAAATVRALAAAERLPSPGDTSALLPPVARAFVRRVTGHNLWLWYRFTGEELAVVTMTSSPPHPVDVD